MRSQHFAELETMSKVKKAPKLKHSKAVEKQLQDYYLQIEDYWDVCDDPLPENQEHIAMLGERKLPKLPFGFFVDEHIDDVLPLQLPLDECIAILKVRFERLDYEVYEQYIDRSLAARETWPPPPNEYGVVPYMGAYRYFLIDTYPKLLEHGYRFRNTNREMWNMSATVHQIQQFSAKYSADKERYDREMAEAKKKRGEAVLEEKESGTEKRPRVTEQ
jgi:hypothetical protein